MRYVCLGNAFVKANGGVVHISTHSSCNCWLR